MAEDRGQALPTGPWQAQSIWPACVPHERPQLTSLLLPTHGESQPLCADSEQLILDLSLSPPSREPINYRCTGGPFQGWILPSALTAEPPIMIQAQMEDKGVGLIDQAAPTPVQRLA